MSSRNPFDARARQTCLNHAVAKFHRRLKRLAHEIDADLAERGFAGLSSHPKINDAFRSLGIVVDEALAFEERAAEFQRQRLRDTGEFDQAGAWTEEDGRQLWKRLRQELEQLPERLFSQAKRLFRAQGIVPRFRAAAADTAEELSNRVDQAFAEGRARMHLVGEKPAAPTKPAKRPVKRAFQAYWVGRVLGTSNQTEIAAEMVRRGSRATQGQVQRWLKAVEEWRAAGGILPTVEELSAQPQAVDPAILDMGARQDGRTPRQRPRRDPDADSDDE